MRRGLASVVVAATLLTTAACSSSSSGPQDPKATATVAQRVLTPISEDGLRAKLQQLGGLDAAYAACTAKALYPMLTDEEKRRLNQTNPPDAITNSVLDKAADAGAGCGP